MTTVRYKARVRRDGSLAIPKKAQEALGLQQGDEVDVVMSRTDAADREPTHNPLYDIIGIGKGGPPDGAENHDSVLYRQNSP